MTSALKPAGMRRRTQATERGMRSPWPRSSTIVRRGKLMMRIARAQAIMKPTMKDPCRLIPTASRNCAGVSYLDCSAGATRCGSSS